jgi:hypothetical protein
MLGGKSDDVSFAPRTPPSSVGLPYATSNGSINRSIKKNRLRREADINTRIRANTDLPILDVVAVAAQALHLQLELHVLLLKAVVDLGGGGG